ncbi:Bestrophin, RFP-TM, chloride channel-domain-containing protein [Mycena belliarum]|uniref:Bestrophin, RFP-TM, chloride channel-domain-containing protein n=1 Tax=Mycena belliarum TaxID=1033014 RepID=A0AAD6UBN7_9AGAR|nr:Bestrophin, RFP-TM, chloride channel-domain-containing protein [Mycena belliae]
MPTNKSTFASVLPSLRPPIKRRHLRRYSWLPDVFRIKGSIISRIFGPVLTVTLFATAVAYADSRGYTLSLTNTIVPLLSVVVGLILVFRNGTSYDRYWEGRKCFGVMTSNVRNLTRLVWIQVALPPTGEQPLHAKGITPVTELTEPQLRRKKIEVLRLCLSFVFSVKHYLRGEDGMHWEDYRGVLPPTFGRPDEVGYNTQHTTASGSYAATRNSSAADLVGSPHETLTRSDATKRVRPKRSKRQIQPQTLTTPLLSGTHRTVEFNPFSDEVSLPLPLAIAHEITRSLFQFRREGFLETVGPAGTNAMTGLVQSMVDQMTAMERVANTPIPISYGIHLKQCVTLYLFALPLTLVKDLKWATIPLVTVVAFTFMGIEGIADEIEMPFGSDPGDLPLGMYPICSVLCDIVLRYVTDRYCQDLKEEIEQVVSSPISPARLISYVQLHHYKVARGRPGQTRDG